VSLQDPSAVIDEVSSLRNERDFYRGTLRTISQFRTWHPQNGSISTPEARLARGVLAEIEGEREPQMKQQFEEEVMMSEQKMAGYMEDAVGRLVPVESIKEVDLVRNGLVLELMKRAAVLVEMLATFKAEAMDDVQAFVELSGEKYGAALGGNKGNVTLYSFDGRFKLIRSMDDFLRFDERLQAAKVLIDECLKRWSDSSGVEIRTIISDAFQVDKKGRINTNRILSLRRIDIEDEAWQQAMAAISDSVQVVNSKAYIRFYERNPDGSYRQLNLNIAV
jgi:Protein of unknown function (DUF3164)